jgi:hypothetical protein
MLRATELMSLSAIGRLTVSGAAHGDYGRIGLSGMSGTNSVNPSKEQETIYRQHAMLVHITGHQFSYSVDEYLLPHWYSYACISCCGRLLFLHGILMTVHTHEGS